MHRKKNSVLLNAFLQHPEWACGDGTTRSNIEYRAELTRRLHAAHRMVLTKDLEPVLQSRAPAELQDWSSLEEPPVPVVSEEQEAAPMPGVVIGKLARMSLPGGLLWIEHSESSDIFELHSGVLFEEVEDGIRFSCFFQEDGHCFPPVSSVIFCRDGGLKTSITASGVNHLRDHEDVPSILEDAEYYLKGAPAQDLWDSREFLSSAWLVSERDPDFLRAVIQPIKKSGTVPAIENRIKSIHPNRFFSEFPGIGDSQFNASRIMMPASAGIDGLIETAMGQIDTIMKTYPIWCAGIPVDERPEQPGIVCSGLHELLNVVNGYKRAGAHVFHLNGDLSKILEQTSLEGLMCDDIKLPYGCFYLSFEEKVPFSALNEALVFEGAYLQGFKNGDRTSINVTMIVSPERPSDHPVIDFRTPISFSLDLEVGKTLEDSLLSAVEEGGYDVENYPEYGIPEDAAALADSLGIELRAFDKSSQNVISEIRESSFGSVVDCLRIIGNSLLLINAKPDQVQESVEWSGASKEALYQLDAPSKKGRERGRRMAIEEGVLPVRVLSLSPELREEIRDAKLEASEATKRGSPSVAYWRKGFWKRQPHGPGNSLRKWVWIEPKLCNEKVGIIAKGSHYENRGDDTPAP